MKKINLVIFLFFIMTSSYAKIWKVGATRTYTKPSQVANLVSNGDTVDIDAGAYTDCCAWNASNLLLRGVGTGYAHMQNVSCQGKGIWIFNGENITAEKIEFSGASVVDLNGAGIRGQCNNFIIRNCYFHDNENGILASPPIINQGTVVIENSEFANNGAGDGYSHNIYINHYDYFILRYCYSHGAKIGHEVKSRATNNFILYNRITNEANGTASYNVDIPNGGNAFMLGNSIEQSNQSGNNGIIAYGLEGLSNPGPHKLYFVNNSVVNHRTASAVFLNVSSAIALLKLYNNIFAGPGTYINGVPLPLDSASNWRTTSITAPKFINEASYNYELTSESPLINKGTAAGIVNAFNLTPNREYVHRAKERVRGNVDAIDIGAYEFGNVTGTNAFSRSEIGMMVFPNPTATNITVLLNNLAGDEILTIVDILGQPVYTQKIDVNSIVLSIDLSNIKSGVYSIMIETKGKTIHTKLIKE